MRSSDGEYFHRLFVSGSLTPELEKKKCPGIGKIALVARMNAKESYASELNLDE
jgi:hypothetical protein